MARLDTNGPGKLSSAVLWSKWPNLTRNRLPSRASLEEAMTDCLSQLACTVGTATACTITCGHFR
jgi:hypothetical protein